MAAFQAKQAQLLRQLGAGAETPPASAAEALAGMWRRRNRLIAEDPSLVCVIRVGGELNSRFGPGSGFASFHEAPIELMAGLVRQGQKSGEFRSDLDAGAAARAIFACVVGTDTLSMLSTQGKDMAERSEEALALLLPGLAGHPPGRPGKDPRPDQEGPETDMKDDAMTEPAAAPVAVRPHRRPIAAARALNLITSPYSGQPRFHRWLYQASGGRLGHGLIGAPTLLLHTTGRRTGTRRSTSVVYDHDRGRAVIGSSGRQKGTPGWCSTTSAPTLTWRCRSVASSGGDAEGRALPAGGAPGGDGDQPEVQSREGDRD